MGARSLPNDLIPLPTAPYPERPIALPLNVQECRTAIWRAAGNVTKAAEILKVPSLRLRNFIKKSPFLQAEVNEATEQIKDRAEMQIVDALEDEADKGRADAAAKFILQSVGRDRGWGSGSGPNVSIKNSAGGTIVVGWADGTDFSQDNNIPEQNGAVIEHE